MCRAYRRTCSSRTGASGDRGDDRDLVAVGDLRIETAEVADVIGADVDADERLHVAVLQQLRGDAGVLLVELADRVAHGARADLDIGRATREGAQGARDSNARHGQGASATCTGAVANGEIGARLHAGQSG